MLNIMFIMCALFCVHLTRVSQVPRLATYDSAVKHKKTEKLNNAKKHFWRFTR